MATALWRVVCADGGECKVLRDMGLVDLGLGLGIGRMSGMGVQPSDGDKAHGETKADLAIQAVAKPMVVPMPMKEAQAKLEVQAEAHAKAKADAGARAEVAAGAKGESVTKAKVHECARAAARAVAEVVKEAKTEAEAKKATNAEVKQNASVSRGAADASAELARLEKLYSASAGKNVERPMLGLIERTIEKANTKRL